MYKIFPIIFGILVLGLTFTSFAFAQIVDSDGDGVPDSSDICQGGDDNADIDGDGTPNGCDVQIIAPHANINDCSLIGTWDEFFKTCSMTTDASIFLIISNDDGNLTFRGKGHTLTSPNLEKGTPTVRISGSGISRAIHLCNERAKTLVSRHAYNLYRKVCAD